MISAKELAIFYYIEGSRTYRLYQRLTSMFKQTTIRKTNPLLLLLIFKGCHRLMNPVIVVIKIKKIRLPPK